MGLFARAVTYAIMGPERSRTRYDDDSTVVVPSPFYSAPASERSQAAKQQRRAGRRAARSDSYRDRTPSQDRSTLSSSKSEDSESSEMQEL
jgi:hypothetical protein